MLNSSLLMIPTDMPFSVLRRALFSQRLQNQYKRPLMVMLEQLVTRHRQRRKLSNPRLRPDQLYVYQHWYQTMRFSDLRQRIRSPRSDRLRDRMSRKMSRQMQQSHPRTQSSTQIRLLRENRRRQSQRQRNVRHRRPQRRQATRRRKKLRRWICLLLLSLHLYYRL